MNADTEHRITDAQSSNLDCLRALAVMVVLVDHFVLTLSRDYTALSELGEALGRIGVLAFFVHTSFVLMQSLDRLEAKTRWPSLAFYLRRCFRIYPLAVLTIVAVLVFRIPPESYGGAEFQWPSAKTLLLNLLLFQNVFHAPQLLAPMWSLPFEVQMYIALPFLHRLVCRPQGWHWALGLLVLAGVSVAVLMGATGRGFLFTFIPCFLAGILSYSLSEYRRPLVSGTYWWLWVLGGVLTFSWLRFATHGTSRLLVEWMFCGVVGMSYLLFQDSPLRRLNWVFKMIARYSYSIYLVHIPALWLVFQIWQPTSAIVGSVICLLLIAAVSVLLYHLVEEPMIRLGQKLSAWPRPIRIPSPDLSTPVASPTSQSGTVET